MASANTQAKGAGFQHSGNQLTRDRDLGREGDPLRYAGAAAAEWVLGPGLRQIQPSIDYSLPKRAGIAEEQTELTVLDPPGGAGILTADINRVGALVEKPGFIDHQHPTWTTNVTKTFWRTLSYKALASQT